MSAATAEREQVHRSDESEKHGAGEWVEVEAARAVLSTRLLDSLLHDVRNPLNAMVIHLDVLTEKLKVDGRVPPSQEKNLKAMREQIFRVDGLLRHYAEFLADGASSLNDTPVSELVSRAVQVLGHEARRAQVELRAELRADLRLRGEFPRLGFWVAQALQRAIGRSPAGSEIVIQVSKEGSQCLLRVRDGGGSGEPSPFALPALRQLVREQGGQLWVEGPELTAVLPLG